MGFAVAVASLLAACGGGGDAGGLPDVRIEPLGGGAATSLQDVEGPAVINLWATWCVPCRREIPDFEAVHQARGDVVRFVGINVGEEASTASEFLDEVGATYDQYLDPVGDVSIELEASQMPTTVVIDADGTVIARSVGVMDQDALNTAIDDALAG